jgi:hypothetical protein
LLTISKSILAGLLLTFALFGSACFTIATQDEPGQNQNAFNQDVSNQDRDAPDQNLDVSNQDQDTPDQNQDASNQNQDVSDQDASAEASFGYAFEPDQDLVRGIDDEPTSPSGPGSGSDSASPEGAGGDSVAASQTPVSPSGEGLLLDDPPEERVTRINPEPLPEELLPRQSSNAGLFESKTMIIIMVVLLVLMLVSGIGVVKNW